MTESYKNFIEEMRKPTRKFKCYKCSKEIEIPNPPINIINSWGCLTKTVFVNANLIVNGWHIRNRSVTDIHPFYCPDCWDGTEQEYIKLPKAEEWVEKGKEWLRTNNNNA